MSDIVRLELTGKRAEAWDRVFETLTSVIEGAVDHLVPESAEQTRETAHGLTRDIAEITKGFVSAKLEKPALENELTIAEIAIKFEELKLSAANREQIEVETAIRKVALEKERLDLWERRMSLAFKWLGFLQTHISRSPDGSVTLVLTNQDMSSLLSEVRAIQNVEAPNLESE